MLHLGNYDVKVYHGIEQKRTHVSIIDRTTKETISSGNAKCHPKDSYCRKTGRKRALQEAISSSPLSKAERAQMWSDYFNK